MDGTPRSGLLVAVCVALVLWLLLAEGMSVTLLAFVGAAALVAFCIWVVLASLSAVQRMHDLKVLRGESRWGLLVGGHIWRCALAALVATPAGAASSSNCWSRPNA